MNPDSCVLPEDDPAAMALTAALKQGNVEGLRRLLDSDPRLARCLVQTPSGNCRTPLHLLADWPGHAPNAAAVVRVLADAGADLEAPAVGMWHRETPLHWAASNNDVELIDALLDAGVDIERAGSSIDGRSALSCAVGYRQYAAARRLVERGAQTQLWHEAALGLMPALMERINAIAPTADELSGAFWNACAGGQLAAARYLLGCGSERNWPAPWSKQTPLDIAEQSGHSELSAWLRAEGGTHGERTGGSA